MLDVASWDSENMGDILFLTRRVANDAGKIPKELALDVARHVGLLARAVACTSVDLLGLVNALLASVAARAHQAHSVDFLIDTLDVMCDVGGCEPEHVNMVLTATLSLAQREQQQ